MSDSFFFFFTLLNRLYFCLTRSKIELDRGRGVWIRQNYTIPKEREDCCEGYEKRNRKPLICDPVCDPNCVNSECMAPDTCVCYPGHQLINNSTSTCYDVCDACINGACEADAIECTCFPNHQRDETFPHICNPICDPPCVNATCNAPDVCGCFEGFSIHPEQDNVCLPKCSEGCFFGTCTAPEDCTCFEGYINDASSPSICLPVCDHPCVNGDCAAPDSCKCREGFELHPRHPYTCVPEVSENSSLNFCELKMHEAVKYDIDNDCFQIKDKVVVSGDSGCQPLRVLSIPDCSRSDTCGLNECVLNFRCVSISINGTKEIHCYLEIEDFETDSSMRNSVNGSDWTDVTLVVNSFQPTDSSVSSHPGRNQTWSLRPTNKRPVCGQMHFAVEIGGCDNLALTTSMNTSLLSKLNVFLVTAFLLLVGAGVGGFVWARHRRLHDPLNYRGDMMSGYYNNQCYDNQVPELVSDDDDEDDNVDINPYGVCLENN